MKKLKNALSIFLSANIALSALPVLASQSDFPYKQGDADTVENVDRTLFSESRISYPLNSDFESSEDICTQSGGTEDSLSLSEDAYSGRFSLGINAQNDGMIKIRDCDPFVFKNSAAKRKLRKLSSLQSISNSPVSVSVVNHIVNVHGTTSANTATTIAVLNSGGSIKYINQGVSDSNGDFSFSFKIAENGEYTLKVGSSNGVLLQTQLNVTDDPLYINGDADVQNVSTKTNIVSLWVKPQYQAESISFYTTVTSDGEQKQVRIMSDKDGDGVFRVGEDLYQGKWQKITLNLLNLESETDNTVAEDLYISANENSNWSIDLIESEYLEFNSNEVDLEQFAGENVEYSDGKLQFAQYSQEEQDKYNNSTAVLEGSINLNEKISGIDVNSGYCKKYEVENGSSLPIENNSLRQITYTIDGMSDPVITLDGNKVFYRNTNDNDYLYCYNIAERRSEKVLEKACTYGKKVNRDGTKVIVGETLYDLEKNTETKINSNAFFAPNDEILMLNRISDNNVSAHYELYRWDGDTSAMLAKTTNDNSEIFLSSNGKYVYFGGKIYKNNGDSYQKIADCDLKNDEWSSGGFITSDGAYLYYWKTYTSGTGRQERYKKNINTGVETSMSLYNIIGYTDDDRLITTAYIYNPSTEEYTYFGNTISGKAVYVPDSSCIVSADGSKITLVDIGGASAYDKYLLSFDGKKTWRAYRGGRWITASIKTSPTLDEIEKYGMASGEIGSITQDDFAKLYSDSDVYTMYVAMEMHSSNPYITPVVNSINVITLAKKPVDCLYSTKLFCYNKNDYNKVTGLFPTEDFPKMSECYYFMYIGNDWLYTYKNGKISKVGKSADELIENISANWLDIKQNGMDAQELRSISADLLTGVFVNDALANDEFGVISIAKIDDKSTVDYKVDLKVSGQANYLSGNELVLEIKINGGNTITFMPEQITKSQIDDFLGWLDKRQNGSGNVFYHMKTAESQNFINYYTITSVNVYDVNEYKALAGIQQ